MAAAASKEEEAYSPYEERRIVETDKLVTALSSTNCFMRWEGVRAGLASWEHSFFLYREIDKRIGSHCREVNDRLRMIRQFIDDESDAMVYGEKLAEKIKLAHSEKEVDLLHITKELENTIADRSDKVLKKILALDLLVSLGAQSKPFDLLQSKEAGERYTGGTAIVMKQGFLALKDTLRRKVIDSIIWGLTSDSFAARYFAQRSLEMLSKPLAPSICVDPTDPPNADNLKQWEDWWRQNYEAVVSSPRERQKRDQVEAAPN